MKLSTLKDLIWFAQSQSLMNQPFAKVWAAYTDTNRLPNPPKKIIIKL